jgi:hypothetical protein
MTVLSLDVRDFAIRELGCTACSLYGVPYRVGCEKHHLNEGDQPGRKRRGERFTVGLCQWHHVGRCHCTGTVTDCPTCRLVHGPSWRHHKREFLDTFGDGDQLLAVQDSRIERWRKYG